MPTTVQCPTCKQTVTWSEQSKYRPFCSKRCQLIDLGEWSEENNKISSPISVENQVTPEMLEDIEEMLAANQEGFFKE